MNLRSVFTNLAKRRLRSPRGSNNPRLLLLQKMPKRAVCAEIGVWKGDYSELILGTTLPEKLHLIDPWEFQGEFSERMYGGAVAKSQTDMDSIYENVKKRFAKYQNVVLNKGKSEKVLHEFRDGYFEWVYIDGNHYYDYVLKDLEICFSKVKPSGIIAGDDYTWGEKDGFPVRKAVQEFTNAKGLQNNLRVIGSQFIIQL